MYSVVLATMLAAGGYKIFKALRHGHEITHPAPPENWGLVALGTLVAAAVSFIAVKWLLRYVQTHTFNAFGWYRLGLGILILLLA